MTLLFKLVFYILSFVIVFSNLEVFSNNTLRKLLLNGLFAVMVFYTSQKSVRLWGSKIHHLFLWSVSCLLYGFLFKYQSLSSDMTIFLIMDVGMIIIGASLSAIIDEDKFISLLKVYTAFSALACLYYISFFDTSSIYGFALKHCVAGNTIISCLILIYCWKNYGKLVHLLLLLIHIYTIINLNTRSAYIGFITALVMLAYIDRHALRAYIKQHTTIGILSVATLCVMLPKILSISRTVLRLDQLDELGAERYSADRIPMLEQGLSYIDDYLLFGIYGEKVVSSDFYVECFAIEILVQYGLIGCILYLGWLSMIGANIIRSTSMGNSTLAKILFIALLMISLFSQHAPMGPGTAYGFAWIIFGFYGFSLKNKN